ncbi:MAG: PIN domain-containing protein [Thermoleophilaceae bacterium]
MLDAFALVTLARDEPAAGEVEALLRRGDCVVTAVNLAEVLDQFGRVMGQSPERLETELSPLLGGALTVVSVDQRIAWRAAELRRRHYASRASELSLADCVALAAVGPGDSLATADPPLARAAQAEALEVIRLPDSRGRQPPDAAEAPEAAAAPED